MRSKNSHSSKILILLILALLLIAPILALVHRCQPDPKPMPGDVYQIVFDEEGDIDL